MPNHVENHIEFSGDKQRIDAMLEQSKDDEYGIGTIDFNKIIPMPESLNIEAGKQNRSWSESLSGFYRGIYLRSLGGGRIKSACKYPRKKRGNLPAPADRYTARRMGSLVKPHGKTFRYTAYRHGMIGQSENGVQNGMPMGMTNIPITVLVMS